MRRTLLAALVFAVVATSPALKAQAKGLIADVRAAIAQNDFAAGDRLIAANRTANGVNAEMLAALSWMARGTLAAKQFDKAEAYAEQTYTLSMPLLATRPLDADTHLPTAVGAAIEVLALVDVERGARSEAVAYLQNAAAKFKGTSIEKRIQKNLNLLTLEGQPAPAIDVSEYLGGKPPSLASLKGKPVLLFFWAHWCGDCKKQAPIVATLKERYGDQFVVYAPTQRFGYVAGGKDAPPEVETPYIDQIRQQYFPVFAGQSIPISAANHIRYGVSSTPTLVLVDRAGLIRMYHPGGMSEQELDVQLKKLIDQPTR